MKKEKMVTRLILGYIVGLVLFFCVIPYLIFSVHAADTIFELPDLIAVRGVRLGIAAVLFAVGAFFGAWSNLFLLTVGKGGPAEAFGVEISPKTQTLVKTGPYRYTRNPMVFGTVAMYFALSIFLNSLSAFIFMLIFLCAIILFLKFSEEKRLVRDFGEEYIQYRKDVSMIVPLPPLRFMIIPAYLLLISCAGSYGFFTE